MRPMTLEKDTCFDSVPVHLYDHSLPLDIRPLKKQFFATGAAAANWLGVNPKHFYKNRGKNITTPKHLDNEGNPKTFAVRVAPKAANN